MTLAATAAPLEAELGLTAFVHARDLDSDAQVGLRSEDLVVTASVFKIPVLLEVCRQVAAGERAATDRIDLGAEDFQVLGGTGIAAFSDPISLSLRDLYLSMMNVSDNRATDVVMDLVGWDRIAATLAELGMTQTVLEGDTAALFASMRDDLGIEPGGSMDGVAKNRTREYRAIRAQDPRHSHRSTPEETTRLLGRIWNADGIDASACAEVRRVMGMQVYGHRLRTGFPGSVSVAGKTGTLSFIRNEAGVVTFPDGRRYAVAVFLRHRTADSVAPDLDRAIGTLGAAAVGELRGEEIVLEGPLDSDML
ncbi:serine hydrolase [Bogoriella caseilytica]|uniref:Beta-lactamase class A n=1 Tax=Bogoriella caseilytica TaxID=56055 RepID=A0A3N2BGD5_9MICO|nr:serine hydrolase [Bogoriella caseilytica]ROR74278.1 beta-lactamase class A [Bogoriella caseilytica]